MDKKKVYRFEVDYGRGYEVEGVFVATEKQVKKACGNTAHFGEICGKHSEMSVSLKKEDFTVLSTDPVIVDFIETANIGYHPFEYVQCEECDLCPEDCECDE